MAHWTILTIDPNADEADVRRTLANKVRGPLLIERRTYPNSLVVAVILASDVETVLAACDVIDRRSNQFVRDARRVSHLADKYLREWEQQQR